METEDFDEAGESVQIAIFIGLSALMILIFQNGSIVYFCCSCSRVYIINFRCFHADSIIP